MGGAALAVLPSRWPGLLAVSGIATAVLPLVAGWSGFAVALALPLVVERVFAAACLGLTPWAALVALLLVWPAWREAVRRDRNLEVSRWSPLEHLASGDPMSWRGS